MDSHETDSKSSRNFSKLTEQVVNDLSIDADSNAILNSCANTNDYKENDITVQHNRDHNVPDNSQQSHYANQSKVPHTRSTSMIGDGVASTSDLATTGISSRKSKQRKSDSSSSSPAMSPSYIQNKQYRTNTPRNVDLIETVMHSNDNKENVPGIHAQYGSTTEHRLDSPKYALQQNSPNTPLSSYKSPPSTHSSPMYTAHEPRTDCNIFTYSPLITEPFKNSTYFHFPDVDTPSPIALATSQEASRAHSQLSATSFSALNNNNVIIATDDKKNNQATSMNNNNNNYYNRSNCSSDNIQIVTSDECCGKASKVRAKEAAVRRARLKSISLDSDGARLVEENLCIPVEELMERALAQSTSSFDEDTPFHSPANLHQSHTKCLSKNINHLVLDLSIRDDSLPNVDYQSSPNNTKEEHFQFTLAKSKSTTPKTPTLSQSRQKAVSLDSDQKYDNEQSVPNISTELSTQNPVGSIGHLAIMRTKPHLMSNFLGVGSNASVSVPTTPRRQQIVKNTMNKLSAGSSKSIGNRKLGFTSSAEYFASKKAAERKCNDKLQMNPETEPIFEGTVADCYDDVYTIEHENAGSFETSTDDVDCDIICGSANSLITNCGNNSGTNQHSNNNSVGSNFLGFRSNMNAAGLSLSNYSLSNFQGSHSSLTRSNCNIFGMTSVANSYSQNVPKTNVTASKCLTPSTQPYQPTITSTTTVPSSRSNFFMKKNLLQRRGSNTSLTLNIVGGGTHAANTTMQSTLNRFNSHNSLNMMTGPYDIQSSNTTIQTAKKGLLERRNSNASLTLQLECRSNIQKRALSTSNCYLRGSDLSLSSSTNKNCESHSEEHRMCTMCGGGGILKKNTKRSTSASGCNSEKRRNETHYQTHQANSEDALEDIRSNVNRSGRRKFLSSENLNLHNAFSLSQLPIKTSSVFDLNQSNTEMDDVHDDQETTFCPCTTSIIRNITTKPLSPQTTSEDFKIYLANIQILQNASNLLTDHKLTTLSNVFNRSYGRPTTVNDHLNKMCDACETCTICKTCKACLTKCRCEQNCLLTNLHQEFWDLPTNYQEKPLVFGSQVKNRYKTILPNEHSRVILDAEVDSTSQIREQPTSELYINANYIKGPDYTQNSYIATQGPMTNTIYDFWLMVYQNYKKNLKSNGGNVDALPFQQKIAMLTDIIENDESKCAIYFPQNVNRFLCFLSNDERRQKDSQDSQSQIDAYFTKHEHEWFDLAHPNEIHTEIIGDNWFEFPMFNFNFFAIKTIDCLNKGGYAIRKFHCLYHTCERLNKNDANNVMPTSVIDAIERKVQLFVVYHYWFPHWPDHRSPENIDVVLDMCINIIDSDCEEELLSANNDLSATVATKIDDTYDRMQLTTSNEHQMYKSHSMPPMLNHVPFNGAMPIIHCSAGIGRTGCVAAILNGLRQLRLSYLSSSTSSALNADTTKHASVDVLGIVSNLRLQRGGMVQNSEQYELIHRALCLYHQRYLSK